MREFSCLVCGKKYQSKKLKSKFCSKPCFYIGRKKRKRIWIERTCELGGKMFNGIPSEVKRGRAKFCMQTCYDLFRHKKRIQICKKCGCEFLRANSTRKYCSRQCFNQAIEDKEVYKYKTWTDKHGYKIRSDGHVHKTIAERAIGRKLASNEVVHHVNGVKHDNRNSNLLICSRNFHAWLHQTMAQAYMKEHFQ